ncbi:MAG: ferrous iron transporter B, partial [Kiritimatiellae bacterium]|nr:ferrous iron transporter B [Kiritimatiellia bacterium]
IDFGKIAKALRCEVVGISAIRNEGGAEAARKAVEMAKAAAAGADARRAPEVPHVFSGSVEHAIAHIEETIQGKVPARSIRWYAIKIFERDREVIRNLGIGVGEMKHLEEHIRDCEKELDDDAESIITSQRYGFIASLVDRSLARRTENRVTLSDKIDKIVTNRFFALPVFFFTLCAMWWLAVAENGPGTLLTDWANDGLLGQESWRLPFTTIEIPGVGAMLASLMDRIGAGETVRSLVVDGAWGGVATVLGFVPVIFIVMLSLAFLEDCGYMARIAFIMDRLFRNFGLSGKSFIPMIVAKGCGVPAVMAARAIENERDRRMTVILATFLPCGAKTVIIAMFSSLFFREQWYVAPLMDVAGIAIIVLGGIALKKTKAFGGEAAPFVMELPAYHMPTLSGIWHHTWNRLKGYVLKAGLVIFPACVVLWLVMNFDFTLALVDEEGIDRSILATVGGWIAWILKPLGFGTWQGAAASISAEIAKEQATATLGLVSSGGDIASLFAAMGGFPKLSALSFMLFNLFVPPCMVAVAVTFREMGSKKWGWFAVGFQLFVGYAIALSAYQIGSLIAGGGFGFWTAVAILVDLWCAWMVVRPCKAEAK